MPHPLEGVEEWRERAAIMEYDGGLTREEAEAAAADRVTGRDRAPVVVAAPGVSADAWARMRQLALGGGR